MPSPFWGRRAGGFYSNVKPKGAGYEWGFIIRIKRGSQNGGSNNSKAKPRSIAYMLYQQAKSRRRKV